MPQYRRDLEVRSALCESRMIPQGSDDGMREDMLVYAGGLLVGGFVEVEGFCVGGFVGEAAFEGFEVWTVGEGVEAEEHAGEYEGGAVDAVEEDAEGAEASWRGWGLCVWLVCEGGWISGRA